MNKHPGIFFCWFCTKGSRVLFIAQVNLDVIGIYPKNQSANPGKEPNLKYFCIATRINENNIHWKAFIQWYFFWRWHIFYVKLKRVCREQTSGETERDSYWERVVAWVINLTFGQVIYERWRNVNPGPYQDGNKAYPKNFWWLIFSRCHIFLSSQQTSDIHHNILC